LGNDSNSNKESEMLTRKKAPAAPAADPIPTAQQEYTAAIERGMALRDMLAANVKEELAFVGERPDAEVIQLMTATRQAAEALVDTGALPPKGATSKRTFQDILRERRAIESAMELVSARCGQLRLKAAGERAHERRDDIAEVGRQMCMSLIALDRVMRARDELVREIGLPPASLPFEAWPLAGRLQNTGSQIYRFLEMGVEHGYISAKELHDEFELARHANP
jgi:hypothetical protein